MIKELGFKMGVLVSSHGVSGRNMIRAEIDFEERFKEVFESIEKEFRGVIQRKKMTKKKREWRVLEGGQNEEFGGLNDRVDLEVYNGSGERRRVQLRLPARKEREYQVLDRKGKRAEVQVVCLEECEGRV